MIIQRRTRIILGLVACLITAAAVVALMYSFAPVETVKTQVTLVPSYFNPPQP